MQRLERMQELQAQGIEVSAIHQTHDLVRVAGMHRRIE